MLLQFSIRPPPTLDTPGISNPKLRRILAWPASYFEQDKKVLGCRNPHEQDPVSFSQYSEQHHYNVFGHQQHASRPCYNKAVDNEYGGSARFEAINPGIPCQGADLMYLRHAEIGCVVLVFDLMGIGQQASSHGPTINTIWIKEVKKYEHEAIHA